MQRYVWIVWCALDVALIFVFAATGRSSHGEPIAPLEVWHTAWPFLLAWAIGSAATRVWVNSVKIWPWGLIVWLVTVAGGMLIRVLTGAGTALPFILVAAGTLGLFLLGRRIVSNLLTRNRVALRD